MAAEIIPVEQLLSKAITAFRQHFDCSPEIAGIAPGRVNLIGEHTDYNEGFVFPMVSRTICRFIFNSRKDYYQTYYSSRHYRW